MKEALKLERNKLKESKGKQTKGKMLQKGVAIMMLVMTITSIVVGVLASIL